MKHTLRHGSRVTRFARMCAGWIRAAVGGEAATDRIVLPDASDRVRVVACGGNHDGSGRLRSRRRRTALLTRPALQMPSRGSENLTLSIFPLVSNEDPLGVVDVVVDTTTIDRPQALTPFIENTTTTLMRPGGTSADRPVDHLDAVVPLDSELLRARSAPEGRQSSGS